ncbi:hypothetical protein MKQ68_19665 [Chitinophaga horti]|uniref:DUF3108 domain-containing protein n=1 Tax=Chitinophaga horti TaxID=2920382 RepID=A0ABY6J1T2_9BACT|nr:DUF6134 family protein [Chitinophaga horti]UYQ92306.1 hypothetical protein MKQ68_19665 [Chitinophaga horti]
MNKMILLKTLFCFLLPLVAGAQSFKYEVLFNNKVVGDIKVNQRVNGTNRSVTLESRVKIKLIASISVDTDIANEYEGNVLVKAKAVRLGNDSKETTTQKQANDYKVVRQGKAATLPEAKIIYAVTDLYITEPKTAKFVYSETLGKLLPVRPLGQEKYEISMPDGKKNIYRYSGGKLAEAEVNHVIGKAIFRRVEG